MDNEWPYDFADIFVETLEGDTITVFEKVPKELLTVVVEGTKAQYPDARGVWYDIPYTVRVWREVHDALAHENGDDIDDGLEDWER